MSKLTLRIVKGKTALFLALACAIYLGIAATPSSYALGMQLLGQPMRGLLAGTPRVVRSDEWIVFTPYVQVAVKSGFAARDMVSPYHESLKAFFALPIRDWAMAFKPYFFAFGLLPAANAFSFFYLFNMLAFLAGWAILLRLLGLKSALAISGSLVLFFSQFIQVWWTSNCGVFALAPWPVIAWIIISNRPLRIAACAYTLTVWLLADAYPPFLYAYGFVLATSIVAMRRDLLTKERLADFAIAGMFALGVFLAYYGDLIQLMRGTVYPGRRVSGGGGVEPAKLMAHLFPFALTRQYEPLRVFANTNACEIAVVGSLVPVTCAAFLNYQNLRELGRDWRALVVFAAGIVICAVWIFLPVPASIGRYVALTFVPGNRLLLALGWLLVIFSLYVANVCGVRYTIFRVGFYFALAVAGSLAKYYVNGCSWKGAFGPFDALPFLASVVLAVAFYFGAKGWGVPLGLAAFVSAVSFGCFNPLQSAYPIFSEDSASIMRHLKSAGAVEASGYVMVPGDYGALINGAGIPSINHVMLSPQLGFFKSRFGDLSSEEFNFLFNRYAHVSLSADDDDARVVKADLISVPMSRFIESTDRNLVRHEGRHGQVKRFVWTHGSAHDEALLEGCVHPAPGNLVLQQKDGHMLPMTSMSEADDYSGCFQARFNYQPVDRSVILKDAAKSMVVDALIYGVLDSATELKRELVDAKRNGVVDKLEVSVDGRRVWLDGWAAADSNHVLIFRLYSGAEPSRFEIIRVRRPDVAELIDPRYLGSGFRIGLSSDQSFEGKVICIAIEDVAGDTSSLVFPSGKVGCVEAHK